MSLNDKYAYIVLSFLAFLNSLAVSKYFRFLVIPKNKGIINKNISYFMPSRYKKRIDYENQIFSEPLCIKFTNHFLWNGEKFHQL